MKFLGAIIVASLLALPVAYAADMVVKHKKPPVCRVHSAIDGRFVSRAYARANPTTTFIACRRSRRP